MDEWFAGSAQLDQGSSNQLRQALYQMLEQHKGFSDYSVDKSNKWGHQNKQSLLDYVLKHNNIISIGIPGSATNQSNKKVINAFAERELSDSLDSMDLKMQMLAILRFAEYNPTAKSKQSQAKGWDYPSSVDDYVHYQAFAEKWVPAAIQTCLKFAKQTAIQPLEQQVALAKNLGIDLSAKSQRQNKLVQTSIHIKDKLADPINERHREVLNTWLESWDTNRAKWMCTVVVGSNKAIHPADFQSAYKQINDVTSSASELLPVIRELKTEAQLFSDHFDGSETKADLLELLESLNQVYKDIPDEMRPNHNVQLQTVRQRIRELSKIVTSDTPKSVMGLKDSQDPIKLLHKISGEELKQWKLVLEDWKVIFSQVIKSMEKFNHENGSNKIEQYKDAINGRLTVLEKSLVTLGGQRGS